MTDSNDKFSKIRENIKKFPTGPGVYLMKDSTGTVLYIGKANNLRDRVSSYFQPSADLMGSRGPRIVDMAGKVTDIGFLECDSEVDAILKEARLIKDIQPYYNTRQTDDKTFPYLEITKSDDFPAVYITRNPTEGSKLYGPFTSNHELRRVLQVIQRIFQFRTCHLELYESDEKRRFNRPCILHSIHQCTAPCAARISKEEYARLIERLNRFMVSKRSVVIRGLQKELQECARELKFEEAARLRDEIKAIESLNDRGEVDEHVQPELFQIDPKAGLAELTELLDTRKPVRVIEGVDIAHIMGELSVGSLVCFIDGRPFKNRYRRFKIREVEGIDDFAMIQEVLSRRYRHNAADYDEDLYPDVIMIDGGLGQLNAARHLFEQMDVKPPMVVSLAKKEELIFVQGQSKPLKLSRHNTALRLLQYVRDEAHRFAQHYFHILQRKNIL